MIVVVGGFLGAGKTTLLMRAAQEPVAKGVRGAFLTNDQGSELVDTQWIRGADFPVEAVTGGCFCCRLSDLIGAATRLLSFAPQVILAEPVGSCTDIIATTIRPLEQLYTGHFRVAPFTVLVDPRRPALVADHPESAWLFQKQIEEADLICYSHADLPVEFPPIGAGPIRKLSGRTGEGVRAWLNEVLSGAWIPAHRVPEVDYEIYAQAESALGWVNWRAVLTLHKRRPPALVFGPLFDDLDAELTKNGIRIGHLKGTASAATGCLKASIVFNGAEPVVDGPIQAGPVKQIELLINLRAAGDPELLLRTVESCAHRLPGKLEVLYKEAFRPARPQPEHRLA